jgi:glycosyltransferase involved in cell wall biosynthesis
MRVLTFVHSFELGGVERVALRLVRHWRGMGVDAPLFLGRNDGPLRDELARHLAYSVPRQPWLRSAWFETFWMIACLPGEIRRVKPDVLFCAGSTYTIVAIAMKLLLGRACPPIAAKISNDLARRDLPLPARFGWRIWLRVQARFIDRWIVMEEAMCDDVAAMLGTVDCSVIPDPAISLSQIASGTHAKRPQGDGRHFVAAGRLVSQKDYPMMLRAFARGSAPADTLTILGGGPLAESLAQQAFALGIVGKVLFAGHVADAAAHLGGYDALLLSSAYEGVPAVLVEAMAAGLPIVATDCGSGVRGMLADGRFGRIVAAGDSEGFAREIAKTVKGAAVDPASFGQARRFTIENAAQRYLDALAICAQRQSVDTEPESSVATRISS